MTLVETLFGGILLIVGTYQLLRLAKIGNYWRGVLSGLFPTVGYLVLASRQWPGGDVVTVHVTVFLAAATVMTIIGGNKQGGAAKLHWAPVMLVAFFAGLAVLLASFVMISVRGLPPELAKLFLPNAANRQVHTAFSGVVQHDDNAAKTISQHLNAQERQRKLGWNVELRGLEDAARNRGAEVSVTARDGEMKPLRNARVTLVLQPLAHAEGTRDVTLSETEPGSYRGRVEFSQPGRWVLDLQIERGNDKYQVEHSVSVPKA